jgi:hypothetical protein
MEFIEGGLIHLCQFVCWWLEVVQAGLYRFVEV